jgi:hypothetical protein
MVCLADRLPGSAYRQLDASRRRRVMARLPAISFEEMIREMREQAVKYEDLADAAEQRGSAVAQELARRAQVFRAVDVALHRVMLGR